MRQTSIFSTFSDGKIAKNLKNRSKPVENARKKGRVGEGGQLTEYYKRSNKTTYEIGNKEKKVYEKLRTRKEMIRESLKGILGRIKIS